MDTLRRPEPPPSSPRAALALGGALLLLNLAVAWEVSLLVLILYLPVLQGPFDTFALSATDWALVLGTAATVLPVLDVAKAVLRRRQ